MTDEASEGAEESPTLPAGTMLGRYEIRRLLGRGGMGCVYEAIHTELKKRVALKTLSPEAAAIPGAKARFLREGEAASRISHPHVVDVTDVGSHEGTSYLVMEFLEGEDLSHCLERRGALPVAETVDLLLPVLAAVSVAHEEGVVHRDLKPGNIFLARTRHAGLQPKVLDFGISKLTQDASAAGLTGTAATFGTIHYMPPEQVRGARQADARSDQYALGAILYECVCGRRAHEGDNVFTLLRSVGEGSFPAPRTIRPDLPEEVEAIILRAMRLDPAERFPSVQALGQALLPLAGATARQTWSPVFGAAGVVPAPITGPVSGQTMILPDSSPSLPPAPRSRPAASTAPLAPGPASFGGTKPPTTFTSSLGEVMADAEPPRRRVLPWFLAGGGIAAVAVAIVAIGLKERVDPQPPPPKPRQETVSLGQVRAAEPPPPPRRTYTVDLTVEPASAIIELDGAVAATGALIRDLPADGVTHTMVLRAPGFEPKTVSFAEWSGKRPIQLEPTPVAPKGKDPGATAGRGAGGGRHHGGAKGSPATGPVKPVAKGTGSSDSAREGANGALIIE